MEGRTGEGAGDTASDPVAGTPTAVDVTLTADQSRLLADGVWDLEMTLGGEVITLLTGAVVVSLDVSRGLALVAA